MNERVDPKYGYHYTAFPERKLESKEMEQVRNQRQRSENNENENESDLKTCSEMLDNE